MSFPAHGITSELVSQSSVSLLQWPVKLCLWNTDLILSFSCRITSPDFFLTHGMKSKFPNEAFGSCQSFHLHLLYSFPGNLIFFHTFSQTSYFPRSCSFPTSWPCQTPTHPLNTHSNKISSVKAFLTLGTTNRDSCFFFCFHISSIVFITLFIFLW